MANWRWHLTKCVPHKLYEAKANLLESRVPVYLPEAWTRQTGGYVTGKPLLYQYLFVQLDHDPDRALGQDYLRSQAALINDVRGVTRIFTGPNGIPAIIPACEISVLQIAEACQRAQAERLPSKAAAPAIPLGSRVRVRRGLWEGYEGDLIVFYSGKARLVIDDRTISTDCADIEAIDAANAGQEKLRA